MRSLYSLAFLIFFPAALIAQTENECDSVSIECCSFNSLSPNSISLQASNASSNIFPYPGFILLDQNGDTVAKETVNTYGIGPDFQEHVMALVGNLPLPFIGTLELHTGFYSTFACSFPISIADTVSTGIYEPTTTRVILFPNPANTHCRVELSESFASPTNFLVVQNLASEQVYSEQIAGSGVEIPTSQLGLAGIYFVLIYDKQGKLLCKEKLIVY